MAGRRQRPQRRPGAPGQRHPAAAPARARSTRAAGVCRALPAPSLQRPDLLDAPPPPAPAPDCAEAVADGDQGATINQVVAALAAAFVEKLLAGTCAWMGAYFDLDDGTLRCVPADPKTVAAVAGLHLNAVAPPGTSAARPRRAAGRAARRPRRENQGGHRSDCARPAGRRAATGAGGRACLTRIATPSPAPSPGGGRPRRLAGGVPGRHGPPRQRQRVPRPHPGRPARRGPGRRPPPLAARAVERVLLRAPGSLPVVLDAGAADALHAHRDEQAPPGLPPGASVRVERRRPRVADGIVLPFQPAGRPEPHPEPPDPPERAGEWP